MMQEHALKLDPDTEIAIPAGWQAGELLNFLELQRGVDLPVQDRHEGDVPIFGSNGLVGFHNISVTEGPGVITGRSGTIGKLFYTEERYWPLNTALYVKNFKGNIPKFVYYKLNEVGLEKCSTGTGVPTLNRNVAHKEIVVFPPLPEQQKIVAILTAVDDKLHVIARQIAARKTLKQGLMQTLFSRGVGIQDASGRWVPHSEFKDSEFGETPIGWECRPIGSFAKIVSGNAFKSNLFNDTGIPIIRISNIKSDFTVRIESAVCYEEDLKLKRFMVVSGDVLIAMSGATTGKVGRYYGEDFCYLNQRVGRFDVDPQQASSDFLFHFLRESTTQTLLLATAAGGAQPNISSGNIESIRLRVPPLNEQTKIAEILSVLDSKLEGLKSKEMHYENIKRGLMQKLLTGKWRVKLDSPTASV